MPVKPPSKLPPLSKLRDAGQERILVTRLDAESSPHLGALGNGIDWDMSRTRSSPSWAASPPYRQRTHRRRLRRHERPARRRGSRVDGRVLLATRSTASTT
ncbi:MAG: hypothetical protein ACLU0O_05085 [Collinsella sp.]